jgi:hypothetical protein
MTRGPYALCTKEMTPEQRAKWFRQNPDKGGRPRKVRLSYNIKQALRQDWGID